MHAGVRTTGLAALAGLIFALGLSPFDFWPAIPLSAGILYVVLNSTDLLAPWRAGLAYGIGFFGAGVSWIYISIHVYGPTPVWLAVVLTVLFCAGLALLFSLQAHLYVRFSGTQSGWRVVQFASLWVLFEVLRTFFTHRLPLGLRRIWGVGLAPRRLDTAIRRVWLLVADGRAWLSGRRGTVQPAQCADLARGRCGHRSDRRHRYFRTAHRLDAAVEGTDPRCCSATQHSPHGEMGSSPATANSGAVQRTLRATLWRK